MSDMKHDGGKPRFSLLRYGCPNALEGVAEVLTFGAKKYADHSWQTVENGVERYWSALERHLNAIAKGEEKDPESGLLHIDHVACNALFLGELLRKRVAKPAGDSLWRVQYSYASGPELVWDSVTTRASCAMEAIRIVAEKRRKLRMFRVRGAERVE